MQRRGMEYYDDSLIAMRLVAEEKQTREKLKKLEISVDEAYIQLLDAEEGHLPLVDVQRLQRALTQAQQNLAAEEKKPKMDIATITAKLKTTPSSNGAIQASLQRAPGLEIKQESKKVVAKPLRTFSVAEMKKIHEHSLSLPEHLRQLLEAVLEEGTTLEFTDNPHFIKGEGRILNLNTINDLLKDTPKAISPYHRVEFTRADVIPCNTLIQAMDLLLHVIDGADVVYHRLDSKLATLLTDVSRKRVKPEVVAMIEEIYSSMLPRHQKLFDIICRDAKTKKIMDDPVGLPDGFVYDRTTAEAHLRILDGACPMNPEIKFTAEDMTPCHFVIAVLDLLPPMLNKIMEAKLAAAAKIAKEGVAPAPAKKP